MRRDIKKYEQAHQLRQAGKSIRTIAKELKISTSTASIWCRGIKLSENQKIILALKGQNRELLRSFAQKRHLEKLERSEKTFNQAKNEILKLQKNELFNVGLALYWAEGFKSHKEQQVGFCNSDPRMVKFILEWFKKSLGVEKENFTLRAEFNIKHKNRGEEIQNYWSSFTGIPRSQFTQPYLQKAIWNRDYANKEVYYGVLRIRVRKSSELLIKIRGWMEGLATAI
ncbi:hypothetical protein A3A14_02065 [Candidatus Daviesbacteria bacterium RIFCSPLOWO2_01_FULL_43_38]|uniref:Resolvase HTH domain-containing protein n=3 Tax=Candidatus Daviesiibacteriota TaxID=1752718 RepID=A0A1F5K838_9BACT|nr:MAG: hypothetical protein UV33_C0026G0005 [Candidatus Daviesbacteria bacterium GW2011_GWA1_42_6]KKS70528.1 MAG: hypothetical protein UV41_C0020G0007 [Candidatus Daviesbacteria bacterium GW2011_GWA2_42_7]OGE19835.1 MAG: hypothetical protein A2874_02825 [Candidatus Daviesbacteria bacterium RIFCSPHIGHO2_01_FULL_43_17]OGE36940.1 MAG: hypothetical protein A3E45_01705 [Candidatus Daviesbacteria bacterium RIFCSPHIGHO2_12_FULL_43_11]OGE63638.1 MAG: hypothetical protein A3A14_02065 [Candidatus Davies